MRPCGVFVSVWILPPLAAALVFAGLAVFVWTRRPPAPLWPALLLFQVCALLWILGELGTVFSRDVREEWLALLVLYTGAIPIGALWWSLALGFAELQGLPTRLRHALFRKGPLVAAAGFWLLFVTNPWHGLYLTPVLGGPNLHHGLWWAHTVPSWILVVGAAFLYARVAWRAGPGSRLRAQAALLIGASLPVVAANAAYVALPGPWPLDPTVVGAALSCILFVSGIYGSGLFDLPPIALREAIEHDPSGVLLLDRSGCVRLVNPAARRLLGDARLVPDACAADLLDELLEPVGPGLSPWRDPGAAGGLFRHSRQDGATLWVTSARLRKRGRSVGSWLRLVDVTRVLELEQQHRNLEARLRRAERLESLGVLAAGIAHEINNPTGSILLAAEHALRTLRDPVALSSTDEALQTIVAEAQRCGRIVRNVLKFAREEPSEKWPIDPNQVARRAAERVAKRAEEAGVRFTVTLGSGLSDVRANPTDLEQALVNVLENALDAGEAGSHLELSTLASPRGVRFVVRDDGPGMSEDVRARALEPFFSTRGDAGGTGLGLSLVHGIVREHGGVLELESEPARGTCITIELVGWESDSGAAEGA